MHSLEELVEILEEGAYLSPELQNEIAVILVANEARINQLIEWNSKANVRAETAEDAYDKLLTTWAEARIELTRLRKIEGSAQSLANYVRRSTNVGPITKGPHKEAALWRGLRDALGETWE